MRNFERCLPAARDPVELLLRNIVDRALLGSLVTGAALASACSDGDGRERTTEPIMGVDSGFLIPVPIPPRDAAQDARMDVVMDAAPVVDGAAAVTDAAPVADAEPSELPADAFDPCTRGAGFPVRAEGLSLATAADYVAVRQAAGIQGAPGDVESWTSDNFMLISERGNQCASANSDACILKAALHPDMLEQSYCVQACVEWSVVTTRADEVERWATPPELLALLGVIDSDDDALMLAAASGYDVTCPAPGESTRGAKLRYVRTTPEGRELIGVRYARTCPVVIERVSLVVTPAGEVRERASTNYPGADTSCVGRVPAGLRAVVRQAGLAGYLAQCAHLEAASVYAFERLASELRAHAAPAELITRALDAAQDEVRHAQIVGALARAHGGVVAEVVVEALPVRTLVEIARENATEGCVRETYGALVGAWQAARAHDLTLRSAMRSIAADEARHAQLSHDVHTWLMTQLNDEQRASVRAAQRGAIAELGREQAPLYREAGLPDASATAALLQALERELWAA